MTSYKSLALALAIAAASTPVMAAGSLEQALKDSKAQLHLRLRYENVEQQGLQDADALTLKSRLTFTTGTYKGFSGLLEMDDTTAITRVDYNDGTGINPERAAIPDPEGTEINQSWLAYSNFDTVFKYGRQRILLDNQRFVGGVGWRQNEQTYDGFTITNQSPADTRLFYAYITNVNRIFGEQVATGDHKQKTHLLNAHYSGFGAGKLSAYAYLIDNQDAAALSSDTYGVRWQGKVNDAFSYNLEYAQQRDAGDNPLSYTADYALLEAIVTLQKWQLTAGYELLGSDDGTAAFSTPLATLHLFQGWSDKFLTTPANGIEDAYVKLGTKLGSVNVALAYHQLQANEGSLDYGSEINLVASTKIGIVDVMAKYADYQADDFATDTRKFWLMFATTF